MKALVFIEIAQGRPTADSLGVVERMAQAGAEVSALVCGADVEAVAAQVARHRCGEVLFAQDERFSGPSPEPRAALVAALVAEHGFAVVAMATSVLTTELAAQVAVACNAGIGWSLTAIEAADGGLQGQRSTHGDAMRASTAWPGRPAIALFRPHECAPAEPGQTVAPVVTIAALPVVVPSRVTIEDLPAEEAATASLDAADIIVSGGRGLRSREELDLVRDLADALGGSVGVSLPLVDMGWAPRSMQVGQTGTVVSPRLYIACGISGQIQHKIGIEKSGLIVAVNTDKDAPIMSFCDLGIVGDLKTVLPALAQAIRAAAA